MGITFLLSMFATLILGNQMSPEQFGEFALLKSFILIGATFSLLGIDQIIIKRGAGCQLGYKYIINFWIIIIISSFFFTLIFKFIFLLTLKQFVLLWIIIFCNSNLIYFAALFRIKHKFIISQLTYNLWKILLFFCSVLLIFLLKNVSNEDLYFFMAIFLFFSFISFAIYIYSSYSGKIKLYLENEVRVFLLPGFIFWSINVMSLFFSGLDRFLITTFASKSLLGEYHAITFIFITTFSMLGSAIGYVLYPFLANKKWVNIRQILLLYLVGCIIIYIIFMVWGELMFSFAYKGTYDYIINSTLMNIILFIGIIQGLHTIIHFIVFALASSKQLILYLQLTIGICIIYGFSFYIIKFSIEFDLISISTQVLFMWTIKLLVLISLLRHIIKNNINSIKV